MALAVALLAGCTNQRAPDNYNGTVRKNFILACQGKNPDQKQTISASQQECTCIYDRFVKDVPFSRFKKVNEELPRQAGPLPLRHDQHRGQLYRVDGDAHRASGELVDLDPRLSGDQAGAGLGGSGGTRPGGSTADSGQRLRLLRDSLCISAMAPGSSSPGRVCDRARRRSCRAMISRPSRCGRW